MIQILVFQQTIYKRKEKQEEESTIKRDKGNISQKQFVGWGGEGRPGCTAILQQMADVWQKPASYCQASIFQYFFLSWLLIKENEISQVKGIEHFPMYGKMLPMYGKMQESGLTETIPLTCTSAVWGQHAVFLHAEFSQGST